MNPYEVNISVFHSVRYDLTHYYTIFINGVEFDYWYDGGFITYGNIQPLNSVIGSKFTPQQLQQYLIENHLVRLHEPPQPPTKLTIAEIEQKLGIKNLEIIGDDD